MENPRYAETSAAGERQALLEAYDRIVRRAHAARAQLLHNALLNCAHKLRMRVCAGAEMLHINFCPLCCR